MANKLFYEKIRVRVTKNTLKMIKIMLKKHPKKYQNLSNFIRILIINRFFEEFPEKKEAYLEVILK